MYDAIVVGARCAGSPTATLLARKGYRVLLVDKAQFPSDIMSTHFIRKPYGPGWALVGDAGFHKDPFLAQGITDAFRDADLLAEAIDAGLAGRRPLEETLADYERERNATALPLYQFNAQYTQLHLAGDLIGLLDALGEQQTVVVGHDWGAIVAWDLALLRPDRVRGVVALSVPYAPRGPISLLTAMQSILGEGFYMIYFQQPGRAEAELERDVRTSFRTKM